MSEIYAVADLLKQAGETHRYHEFLRVPEIIRFANHFLARNDSGMDWFRLDHQPLRRHRDGAGGMA